MTDRPIDSVIPAVVPSGGLKIRGDSRTAMKRPPLPLARLVRQPPFVMSLVRWAGHEAATA
ncbi:hypothetical protein JD77_06122 [Micromonospora olivasterospora]|uniref:Uncharacterized protein n=1 Tax=Micromonospora olivasterospora TaxID=1880 RepID=A0A562IJA9_MICOL|nr:hypothetical protein JD77_06122 [Micromonospora olivasterospora]